MVLQRGSMKSTHFALPLAAVTLLTACGGSSNDSGSSISASGSSSGTTATARGTLLQDPPNLASMVTAAQLSAQLTSDASQSSLGSTVLSDVLTLAGVPECDISVYHIQYTTVGGQGESTTASGALMVPSGSGSNCSGPRPIVLYAHGTNPLKTFNIADLSDSQNAEGILLAAFFAARGYIVVAPNYTGYDTSTLSYHPFLVADAQADDMIDGLTAARHALSDAAAGGATSVSDNGQLFITGYSQGGYVAMATHRAMEALGLTVTASAPMSGPYALEAFVDAEFAGEVTEGATISATMLIDGYQNSYGTVYSAATDVISPQYASGFTTLLPSTTSRSQLYSDGALPQYALFDPTPPTATYVAQTPATMPAAFAPVFAQGFGSGNLIINSYRLSYLQDESSNPDGGFPTLTTNLPATSPEVAFRQLLKANDLRSWIPNAPTQLCGGDQDPTVFFFNTQLMQNYWTTHPPMTAGSVTVLDLDSGTSAAGVAGSLQTEFQTTKAAYAASAVLQGATDGGASAVDSVYHETLVPPFCLAAVISYFNGF